MGNDWRRRTNANRRLGVFMHPQDLKQELTNLLMQNGASVSKRAITALVEFIAQRDQHTIKRISDDINRAHLELMTDQYFGTKIRTQDKENE
jgi:hypothetical protein